MDLIRGESPLFAERRGKKEVGADVDGTVGFVTPPLPVSQASTRHAQQHTLGTTAEITHQL